MTVQEIISNLALTVIAGENFEQPVSGGYVSDLLSNVMGQAGSGNIWITMQGHQNVVAVSLLAGLAAVVIAGGVKPDEGAVNKAKAEGLIVLTTDLSSFEVAGRLYALGIRGN